MDLISWIKHNHLTQRDIAKVLEVSDMTISNIIQRKKTPRLDLALKIYFFTNKEIDLVTLLSEKGYGELESFVCDNKKN